eukprot:TRINITY_DN4760_c0_g1_i1.p1 TRINITY_DN4760_c0_g1~~TRINITY_DN4760_c0_g1_i1.p1  ORF type:complete len:232 (-),score=36.81 TRINITY_DN4760_c0_g1_i1:56-751(-)
MCVMFSTGSLSGPNIIEDRDARSAWGTIIGWDVSCVTLLSFIESTKDMFPQAKNLLCLQDKLQNLLNYPQDGLVTVFKWNELVEQFGPFKSLEDNLEKFKGIGYLGFANRIQAEEMLRKPSTRKLVLVRHSRTRPSQLVFSWKDGQKCYHTLYSHKYGLASLSSFENVIKQKGFSLLPVTVIPWSRPNPYESVVESELSSLEMSPKKRRLMSPQCEKLFLQRSGYSILSLE